MHTTFILMDQDTFKGHIKQFSNNLTDEDLSLLTGCVVYRNLKKGEPILKEGESCRAFYLVNQGYLRTYYNKDGADINMSFTFEGELTTNLKSIKSKQPSEFTIEAGEIASIWVLNLDLMLKHFNSNIQISHFFRRCITSLLLASEEHSNLFKMYTPTERYRYIEKNNPNLLQRISLSQIASYLGVSRETLSRIRAKND